MDLQAYIDEIKFAVTGDILDCELNDEQFAKIVNMALREIQRYICSTKRITIPYEHCIDMSKYDNVNSVSRVYRAEGFGEATTQQGYQDPMYASQWLMLSGYGTSANISNYGLNYASWNTLNQIRNTMSTDLLFIFDKPTNKLYINISSNIPKEITIDYVPRYDTVEEVVSDFWIDVLMRMSIALAKVTLGRIRSRYTQSNALWTQDGETMLAEGTQELTDLRTYLQQNTQLLYVID